VEFILAKTSAQFVKFTVTLGEFKLGGISHGKGQSFPTMGNLISSI